MTLHYTDLPEKCRAQLPLDEQVLWCGKGRPVAWYDGAILGCIVGLAFSLGPLIIVGPSLLRLFSDPKADLIPKIMVPLILGVFLTVGLSLLLSPLWHWLLTKQAIWVITNRRVLRFWGARMKSWSGEQLIDEPEWIFMDDGGRDFVYGRHWVSSKHGGHYVDDAIQSVPPEDVALVESALLRQAECRRTEKDAELPTRISEVQKHFQVLREGDTGRVRIIYRKRRLVWGPFWLVIFILFVGGFLSVAIGVGDTPLGVMCILPLPIILGAWPFVYALAGRREVSMQGGKGVYFNGIGPIGIRRHFTYDGQTLVHQGVTLYMTNGKKLPEVQIRSSGQGASKRLLAHSDEAVVGAFIQHIRQAIRYS